MTNIRGLVMTLNVWGVLVSLGFLSLLELSNASCPDYDITGCLPWSEATTWPTQQVPGDGDAISINNCVILDVNSADLDRVDIAGEGQLLFLPDPDADITLAAKNVRVAGVLRIGSSRCRYDGKAHIVLSGTMQDAADPDFGRKFIGVTADGTLELHGAKKTSWSKVNSTLPKLTTSNGLLFDSTTEEFSTWKKGFLVYVVNPKNGGVVYKDIFYTGDDSERLFDEDSKRLVSLLNWVSEGQVVAMASNLEPISTKFNMTPIFLAMEKAFYCKTGHSRLRHLQPGQSWVGIAVKEHPHRAVEKVGRVLDEEDFTMAFAELHMPQNNMAFKVKSKKHKEDTWKREVKITGAIYDSAIPVVTMTDDVSSWQPGDKVVITSTDYYWTQAEEATVEQCEVHHRNITCDSNQVRLNYDGMYDHWGEVTHRVDMRAEVALLSRNVRVSGKLPAVAESSEQERQFGGQIKIKPSFGNVHIQGVQLSEMGQRYEKDAYPIFFDMCLNVSGEAYTDPAYVRENAILNSFRSCVVLRGTHEMQIQGNVAYKHFGSCFYLLEGGEKNNRIEHNLGLGTLGLGLEDNNVMMKFEDDLVGTFFITNPLTHFRNNVAAGGETRGIIYAFPEIPLRDSTAMNFMQKDEASRTPLASFEDNTAHSNFLVGLDMQYSIKEDTAFSWNSKYEPKEEPLDPESLDREVYIERLTSYKNRFHNVIARGGFYNFHKSSFSDSAAGLKLMTSSDQRQYVTQSVILGESANKGDPTTYWFRNGTKWDSIPLQRSIPIYWDITQPIQGMSFIDGPAFLYQVWFNDFVYTDHYRVGALGFVPKSRWWTSPMTSCEKLSWGFDDGATTGNRAYDGMADVDGFDDQTGDKQAFFRDLDGSVTGVVDSTVIKPYPMLVTDECDLRDNWALSVCPHRYAKIRVQSVNNGDRQSIIPLMSRDDVHSQPLDQNWKTTADFPVVLGGDYSYILFFNSSMPQGMYLYGNGVEKDLWVRFGVCVPIDAELQLWSYSPDWRPTIDRWNQVMSVEDLETTAVASSYYWDKEVGVIFFKFKSDLERDDTIPYEIGQCPDNKCPMLRLTITNAVDIDMSNGDCRDRAYGPYVRSAPSQSLKVNLPASLPATSLEPPEEYGAGAVYTSALVVIKDQGFGAWVEWSDCSVLCGGGVQYRERSCDDPTGCGGPSAQRTTCNTDQCAGYLTEWSTWSECSASCGGGLRSRQRNCSSEECTEPTSESEQCNTKECPIDGWFGSWTVWTACSATCGGGMRNRNRSCDNPTPDHGGADCEGGSSDTETCNGQQCPIDGGFGSWTTWTSCSVTCGGGIQTRSRECDSPRPDHGGQLCDGDSTGSQTCQTNTCSPVDVCETNPPPGIKAMGKALDPS